MGRLVGLCFLAVVAGALSLAGCEFLASFNNLTSPLPGDAGLDRNASDTSTPDAPDAPNAIDTGFPPGCPPNAGPPTGCDAGDSGQFCDDFDDREGGCTDAACPAQGLWVEPFAQLPAGGIFAIDPTCSFSSPNSLLVEAPPIAGAEAKGMFQTYIPSASTVSIDFDLMVSTTGQGSSGVMSGNSCDFVSIEDCRGAAIGCVHSASFYLTFLGLQGLISPPANANPLDLGQMYPADGAWHHFGLVAVFDSANGNLTATVDGNSSSLGGGLDTLGDAGLPVTPMGWGIAIGLDCANSTLAPIWARFDNVRIH